MADETSEMKLHAVDYWQVLRNRYGIILLAFFLVFLTAAVITYILPDEYKGTVKFEIRRELVDYEAFRTGAKPGGSYIPPTFIQTQFEIIKAKETLKGVVEKMNLAEKWNVTPIGAYHILASNLDAREERGTDIIHIDYWDKDQNMAADIANEIAAAYQERRKDLEKRRSANALASLEETVKNHKESVEDARIKMLDIAKRYGIVDIQRITGANSRGSDLDTGKSTTLFRAILSEAEAKAKIKEVETQIATLSKLSGDQLIERAVGLGLRDATINQQYGKYQDMLVAVEAMMNQGRGENHPAVKTQRKAIAQTRRMLLDGAENVKANLQIQLEMAQNALKATQDTAKDEKKEAMDEMVNTVEYVEAKKDYELKKALYEAMLTKHSTDTIDLSMPKTPIVLHENAVAPTNPSRPRHILHLILGAILGLAFGVGLAFLLEYLDTSVKTLDDVEKFLGVPVLAVIPKDVGVLHKQSGLTPDAEAYRILRTNIEFNRKSADANAITVVSGGAGEGKSTTLVNLAYICAQGGYNTLMIDGDLRRPKLHTFFDINNSVGLTNYLTTELMLEDVILQTPVDNLYFMPSGILPADAAGILNSRRMSELIADVKNRFDLVLIDSPPILGVSDASVLASEVDLTMVVIQHRKLPRNMLMRVKQLVENVGGHLLGVVLNNVDVRSDSQYQYYTSYYTYYSPTSTRTRSRRRDSGSTSGSAEEAASTKSAAEAPAATAISRDDDEY